MCLIFFPFTAGLNKKNLIFWWKSGKKVDYMEILTEWSSIYCLVKKCYTVYNTLLILSSMHVTWANLSTENIIFLDFCCCCNANLYYRMADKLSKGSNSSTFKNVWIDIGVIGMQGKGKTRKTVILTKTNNNKQNKTKRTHKKHTIKTYLKKKVLCLNSTELYM